MSGLTFNGVHSSLFKLAILKTSRPLLPENKDKYIDVPHKDGSLLVPDNSKKDVTIEVEFLIKDSENIYRDARNIAAWLSTVERKKLIFDDDLNHAYIGKVINNIELEKVVRFGKFSVQFRCLP